MVKVCDMHDLTEWWVEVEATRTFELDGKVYEIDLCGEHDDALLSAFEPFVSKGRRSRDGRHRYRTGGSGETIRRDS